jgi:hypothetical protein
MALKISPADCQVAYAPDMEKAASSFFASHFPSLAAGLQAYEESRQQQKYLAAIRRMQKAQMDAARAAQMYPALHSTQPAIWAAQQQAAGGGGFGGTAAPPVHHHRHRHHYSG